MQKNIKLDFRCFNSPRFPQKPQFRRIFPRYKDSRHTDVANGTDSEIGVRQIFMSFLANTLYGSMNHGSLLLKWLFFILKFSGKCLVFLMKWIWWMLYNVWIFVFCAFVYFFSFVASCVSWLSSRTGNILSKAIPILLLMSVISPPLAGYIIATHDHIRESFLEAPVFGEVCILSPVMCRENMIHVGSMRNFLMFVPKYNGPDYQAEDKEKDRGAGDYRDHAKVMVVPRENVSSFGSKRDEEWELKFQSAENAEAVNSIIGSVAEINTKFERIKSLVSRVAELKSTVEANARMTQSELQGLHASIGMGPGDESDLPQSLARTVAGLKAMVEEDAQATQSELQGLHASIGMGPGDESELPQSLAGTVVGLKATVEADARATQSELQGLHASIGMGPGDESELPQSLAGTVAGLKATVEADARSTQSQLQDLHASIGRGPEDESELPQSLVGTVAELKSTMEADAWATRSQLQGLHASIGRGPGDESELPQSLAEKVAELKATVEADARATQSALDGIQLSVGVSVGDELEAPKSLASAMAELKSAVEYSMPQLGASPVWR